MIFRKASHKVVVRGYDPTLEFRWRNVPRGGLATLRGALPHRNVLTAATKGKAGEVASMLKAIHAQKDRAYLVDCPRNQINK